MYSASLFAEEIVLENERRKEIFNDARTNAVISLNGVPYAYEIYKLETNSILYEVGVRVGDKIIGMNGKKFGSEYPLFNYLKEGIKVNPLSLIILRPSNNEIKVYKFKFISKQITMLNTKPNKSLSSVDAQSVTSFRFGAS